ncbi:hypothetical protein AGMMS50293_18730 [Spirochaetia bacterium]|nr:hypothetical protein AGMMS50293_18730 [Spirochaetia bacterium]
MYPQNNGAGAPVDGAPAENTTIIALVPFKGSPEDIVSQFGEVLQQELPKAGPYTPYLVDMNHLPPDVPEGGFPAYVCPSPSITNGAPYAISGEVSQDPDDPSNYHLRLYLWEMANERLVFSDEMIAADRAACELSLPSLLGWILSWVGKESPAAAETPPEPASEPATEKWLYLGLRAGSSLRFYDRQTADPFLESQVMHFFNINVALQVSVHLLSFLDIQTEVNFTTDYAPFIVASAQTPNIVVDTADFDSCSLMVPLLFRFNLRKENLMASFLGGIYYIVPLGQMKNDYLGGSFDYKSGLPLGYTAGFNIGMKLGPGFIFLDTRWAADIGAMQSTSGEDLYQRSMVTFNIGYEIGLFTRHKKKPKAAQAGQ